MPTVFHIFVLVGTITSGHEELRVVIDLTTERVCEIEIYIDPVDIESILETSIQYRIRISEIDQVIAVYYTVVILVNISWASRLGLRVEITILPCDLVLFYFLRTFPHTSILESPYGIERITLDVTIHHIILLTFICHHKILCSDIFHQLGIVSKSKVGSP